ncbi:GNAT family N-acetyltransferase [Conexibacter sp. JD483]|uniref:GNAT family N-acetyltransferase n=1 Tax=unclassified Conexibacter TaxID=2627773 RepID=UPI002728869D|nr:MULTISPECIES: GNAT family N-acetyltransferase [unclassified Conexibacter]MDO8185147.1 GNAT family N-acetyltransferase [Conexibacter sp. CPCC 205706]MDO8196857.1 GNAT family N-acetyltransferase [Conexibacter sp. CPCC 205762]MDR9368633.1 GNAT family N-acetyltransferase [Conexibacter sp. JD483]
MPSPTITYRPLDETTFDAFGENLDLAFHEEAWAAIRDRTRVLLPLERTLAAFDGDRLVGTSGVYEQRISIPGGELPCAGVTVITVAPTHRRRGILTAMMSGLLEQAQAHDEPIASLWAAEGGIYERFGFGVASRRVRFRLPGRGAAPRAPFAGAGSGPDGLRIELLPLDGAGPLLAPVWARMRGQRPGVPARTPDWWAWRILADPREDRHGALPKRLAVAFDGDGDARGYALYRAKRSGGDELELLELIAPDRDAEAALWRYLGSIDLIASIDASDRPVDDPLPFRFDDWRQPWPAIAEWPDAMWLRLLDLPAALQARSWNGPLDVTLEVADRRLARNAGRWRLQVTADGAARCAPADGDADLALDVATLGAAYLGGTTLTTLADAGRVAELTPGALARLDLALHVPRAPWTPEFF